MPLNKEQQLNLERLLALLPKEDRPAIESSPRDLICALRTLRLRYPSEVDSIAPLTEWLEFGLDD